MRAAGGMLGAREFGEQPLHAPGVERHVDLDGGMAGDGCRNACAERAQVLRLRRISRLLQHLHQHAFEVAAFEANRRGLDRQRMRAEGLDLKAIALQFLRDAGEEHHLVRLQIDEHGHQQALPLHTLHFPLAKDLLKEHALMGHMLVDDPQTLVVDGEDERLAQLPQRLERGEGVQVRGLSTVGQCFRCPI